MKKLCFLSIVCFMSIFQFPSKGYTEFCKLSVAETKEISAQAGISISLEEEIVFDTEIDTIAFGDGDGKNGSSGYLSLNDFSVNGTIIPNKPIAINMSTRFDPDANIFVTGMDLSIQDVTINLNNLHIGSITVGNEPGAGKSFGSLTISNMSVHITGDIRIMSN